MTSSFSRRRGFTHGGESDVTRMNGVTPTVDKYELTEDAQEKRHQRQRSEGRGDASAMINRNPDYQHASDYANYKPEETKAKSSHSIYNDDDPRLTQQNGTVDGFRVDAAKSFTSEQEPRELLRQKEDEIRRLKSQVERYRGLKGGGVSAADNSLLSEENSKLHAKINNLERERAEDKSKLSQMSSRLGTGDLDDFTPYSRRGTTGGYYHAQQQQRPGYRSQSPPSHPMMNGGSKNMNGQQPSMNGDNALYREHGNPNSNYNDPMIVDKMQLRIEALERELETERGSVQRLKEDKQRLSENIMQLQQESPSRQVAGSNPGSKYEDANTNIINSQHHEIKLLKAALESAKKEKRMLEEDHAKEKAMLLESNSKGESMRREMIELKKDFDDMQAAVLQLKYELKLRNETIAELQQQLIFYQQLDKKRAAGAPNNDQQQHALNGDNGSKKNNALSGFTIAGASSAPGSNYVSDPSTIFECSRCHQLFKDMSQFQGHITSCLEYRLFHAANNRSKSADRGSSGDRGGGSTAASMTNISKPSPFPSSPLDNYNHNNSASSTILTKYSYDNLRAAGLTNSSSQLKISAIDSRPAGTAYSPNATVERPSSNHTGGPPSKKQQAYGQAHMFDPNRSHAVSTPHLPVHDVTSFRERSNSELVKPHQLPHAHKGSASLVEEDSPSKPESKVSLNSSVPEVVRETVSAAPTVLQMSKPTTDWKRETPAAVKATVAPKQAPDTHKVHGTKSPEAQFAPNVMHLRPTPEPLQTRHSFSSSHSSSDYAKETSLELENEVRINRDPPQVHIPKSQSSTPLEGVYEPKKMHSAFSPPSTLEKSSMSNQPDEQHPMFSANSVHTKAPSAPELLFDMAAAEAREKFLQASKAPETASQQPPRVELDGTTSPVYGNMHSAESQYHQQPQVSGQWKPPRQRPSSQVYDDHDSGAPPATHEQPRSFVRHLNPQSFNRNGSSQDHEREASFAQRPPSPENRSRPELSMDFRAAPPSQLFSETPKSPIERKSISFDDNEMIKKGNTLGKQSSAFDVNRPTPNSILKNAPKGLQIIDKVNGGGSAQVNVDADLPETGANSKYHSVPRESRLSSNNNNVNQNDSDSNSSRQAEKERKYERSKSPSIKNLKNRFFASDKKDKGRKSAPASQDSTKSSSQQSEDKPAFARSASNSNVQPGPMKAFPQKSAEVNVSVDAPDAPSKASFRPRSTSKDRPQVEPPKPPSDHQPHGSLRRPAPQQHPAPPQRNAALDVSAGVSANVASGGGPAGMLSPQNSFDRRGRPGPGAPSGPTRQPQNQPGGPVGGGTYQPQQPVAAGGQYRRVNRPRSQPPPPQGQPRTTPSNAITTDV